MSQIFKVALYKSVTAKPDDKKLWRPLSYPDKSERSPWKELVSDIGKVTQNSCYGETSRPLVSKQLYLYVMLNGAPYRTMLITHKPLWSKWWPKEREPYGIVMPRGWLNGFKWIFFLFVAFTILDLYPMLGGRETPITLMYEPVND